MWRNSFTFEQGDVWKMLTLNGKHLTSEADKEKKRGKKMGKGEESLGKNSITR